jgi:Rrf2 family protein
MKVSHKTEYACLAMLELAARYESGDPVRIRTIADEHGIPSRFLVQILLQLKGAGFVTSTRGASGGYQLVKPPEEISLGEVMAVIEGQEPPIKGASAGSADSASARVLVEAWREVAKARRDALYDITFGDLMRRIGRQSENMFHI